MARRAHADEMEFGSDSFLDVVANIVGILIILVVVAGIKAGTAPVSAAKLAEFLKSQTKAVAAPQPVAAPAPVQPLVIPASPELVQRAGRLKAQLAALQGGAEEVTAGPAVAAEQDLRNRLDDRKQALDAETMKRDAERNRLADERRRIQVLRTGLQQIEVDVKQAEGSKPPAKAIRHKLTPLSRDVQGKEIHFRLAGNRVCYLPIEELLERLRPQIMRQKERLARQGSQRGQVGPVRGFYLEYVAEVQHVSMVDELRNGGTVSVGVRNWQLVAEPDIETETFEDAVKSQSSFMRALQAADPETTITFWVYPDSFGLYQRLQEVAHRENFTVAGRPLPFGVSIAGSPQGMRSSGQ